MHYGTGEWAAAISAFEADSLLQTDDWAVYRTALIYARPDRETFDPDESRRLLGRLIGREPASAYAAAASTVVDLLDQAERVPPASAEDARLHRADWLLYRIGLAYADPDGDLFDAVGAIRTLGDLVTDYPESVYAGPAAVLIDLLSELRRSYRAESALRQQLDQLKQVDLEGAVVPPPPPPPPPGGRG